MRHRAEDGCLNKMQWCRAGKAGVQVVPALQVELRSQETERDTFVLSVKSWNSSLVGQSRPFVKKTRKCWWSCWALILCSYFGERKILLYGIGVLIK